MIGRFLRPNPALCCKFVRFSGWRCDVRQNSQPTRTYSKLMRMFSRATMAPDQT